jgi:hypothetical protein
MKVAHHFIGGSAVFTASVPLGADRFWLRSCSPLRTQELGVPIYGPEGSNESSPVRSAGLMPEKTTRPRRDDRKIAGRPILGRRGDETRSTLPGRTH